MRSKLKAAVLGLVAVLVLGMSVPALAHHQGPGQPPERNDKSCVKKDGTPKTGQGQAKHCPYPPRQSSVQVSSGSVASGSSITVSGSGFCNHAPNTVDLDLENSSAVIADLGSGSGGTGSFSRSVTIPKSTKAGSYLIAVSGLDANCDTDLVSSAALTVTDPKKSGIVQDLPGGLPTGLLILAVILAIIGRIAMSQIRRSNLRKANG